MRIRVWVPVLAVAIALAMPASAGATTFCVPGFHSACTAGGGRVSIANLETAMQTNGQDGIADTIRIAPGTLTDAETFELDSGESPTDIGTRVRALADANRGLLRRHPWLAEVATDRPPLGPGQLRKYELELGALDGLGLSDHEMDFTLTLVTTYVRAHVGSLAAAGSNADEAAWWEHAGPALARHADPTEYPLGTRVGSAVGAEQGRAVDPDTAYAFGVERIAAGVADLLVSR